MDEAKKKAFITMGKALIELAGDDVPEGGFVGVNAWKDHVSVSVFNPNGGGAKEYFFAMLRGGDVEIVDMMQ